jgi:hypothetical protein
MRILKIDSLPDSKQWVDRSHIMLHACFQILQDCVEKENVDNRYNYEAHKDYVDEIRFLYSWWIKRKNDTLFDEDDVEDGEMLNRLIKIRLLLWT